MWQGQFIGFTAISTSPASVLNMFSLYLSAWPDLIHKVLFTIGMQASQLFGSAMDKRVCPLLSPCIAVRRDHFEVAAKSACYGRSPALSCGSGYILGAIGCAYACRSPPRTKPRFASLVPKGSLSLTRMRIFAICRHISDGSIHLELHILNFRSIPHRLLL